MNPNDRIRFDTGERAYVFTYQSCQEHWDNLRNFNNRPIWSEPENRYKYITQNTESYVRFRGLRLELETLVTDLEYEEV